jgi:hypothetical protein
MLYPNNCTEEVNMSKQNGNIPPKPRRPRQRKDGVYTPEEGRKYEEYLYQLRAWLNSLSDEEHDRAVKRLTIAELDHIIMLDNYENYQKGGALRELLEGTCFEGTLWYAGFHRL